MAAVFAASGASAQVGWYGAADLGYHWPEGILGESSNQAANNNIYIWRFNQQDDYAQQDDLTQQDDFTQQDGFDSSDSSGDFGSGQDW